MRSATNIYEGDSEAAVETVSRQYAGLSDLLDALQAASAELAGAIKVDQVAEAALRLALELTGSAVAFIRLDHEGGGGRQVFSRGAGASAGPSQDLIDRFVAAATTPGGAPNHAQTSWAGPDLEAGAVRSFWSQPLKAGDRLMGVIGVARESGYTALQRSTLSLLSNQIAAAFEIARQRERRQERVDALVNLRAELNRSEEQRLVNDERARSAERVERAHELAVAVLLAVSAHVGPGQDLPEFYRKLSATVAELVGAGKVLFWQLVGDGMLSAIPGGYGIDDAFIARLYPTPCLPARDDLVARVVFRDYIFRASRTDESQEFAYVLDALGVQNAISAPWRAGDTRLGMVAAYDSKRAEGFTREDGWVIQKAGLAAGLVWQLKHAEADLVKTVDRLQKVDAARQLLLKNVSTAVDKASKRIAGQLHDDALQKLTAAELQLQRLQGAGNPNVGILDEVHVLLAQTEDALRRLLFEVRPPTLDLPGGFEEAIRDRIAILRSLTGAEVEVDVELPDKLVYEFNSIVFRQVAEAITNIEKHAAATRVQLSVRFVDGAVHGLVVDNGRGFVVEQRDHLPGHIGLLALNERSLMVGGWTTVVSEPGLGTRVEFWMPIG